MASPGLSEIVTTTLRKRSGKLADNMSDNNALLFKMSEKGTSDPVDGGRTIVEELEYADNGTVQRYSGAQTLDIFPSDIITGAEFDWKQMAVAVFISGLEGSVQNTGENALIKLISARVKNAERSAKNTLAADLYSDGTASTGKQVGGLQLLIADDPTTGTVGGINRATASNAFWRNQNYDISVSGSGAASSANIQGYMQTLFLRLCRQGDRPNLGMTDNNFYQHFWSSMVAIQRVTNAKMASAGFENNLEFAGVPIVPDGGQGGACPANHLYFLNTEFIKLRPHSGRNWVPLETVQSINQDATVRFIVWAGNMTGSNLSLQGVLNA